MLKVVAKTVVREDSIEEFKSVAKELVEKSKTEKGNISYSLNQSTSDPKVLTILEIWEDMDALKAHCASEHFVRIAPQLGQFAEQACPIEMYSQVF